MSILLRLLGILALVLPAQAALAQDESADITTTLAVPAVDPANIWVLDLSTGGPVRIVLRPDIAPNTVERIKTLSREGFYDGLVFHRVIPGFMAQGGDPKGDGTGDSDLPDLKAEFNAMPHVRGAVSMARMGDPDTANSQFFIMLAPRFSLDGKYTVFGRVISGMEYVDAIHVGEPPADPTRIVHARIEADPPRATAVPAPAPTATPEDKRPAGALVD